MAECAHVDQIKVEVPGERRGMRGVPGERPDMGRAAGRAACAAMSGCCDSSPGTHATKHYQQTGHAIMSSAMPGDSWSWCFVDEVSF